MALFVPLLVGAPIGYFTWTKVFDYADNQITHVDYNEETKVLTKTSNSTLGAVVGTVGTIGILSKAMFTPSTRHRLFFAKLPANSNIRIETLKLGMELLLRSGIVFYGGAVGGALAGRIKDIGN